MFPGQGFAGYALAGPETPLSIATVVIPPTATSPATLALSVGLYDYAAGERLRAETGADAVVLDAIPTLISFGCSARSDQCQSGRWVEVSGMRLTNGALRLVEEVVLTVYIRPIDALNQDYTILPNSSTQRQHGGQPSICHKATTQWSSDTVQTVTLPLHVDPAAPALFPLIVGAYTSADGIFENLPIVVDKRITNDNFYQLTQVRIDR